MGVNIILTNAYLGQSIASMPNDQYPIRFATAADVPALATLHVQTFIETHGSGPGAPTLQTREYQWRELFGQESPEWFCFVIENENGELIGFARGVPYYHSDNADYSGELNKIYLLRQYQKKGLGRQLVCRVAEEFLNRGITSMLLFGDAANPSNHAYESWGGEKLYAKNGEFHGGYGWPDLQKLIANCPKKI